MGDIYYLKQGFTPLAMKQSISVGPGMDQGLFNVVADPGYETNHLIYLLFTTPDGAANQVDRFSVDVDLSLGNFILNDRQTIITFPKNESPAPDGTHNGGGLLFDENGNLLVAMGDGGNPAGQDPIIALSQNPEIGLGKVHRLTPNRTAGGGGFTVPPGNNNSSVKWPSLYALGFRNPFTMIRANGALYVGDVGNHAFEEIDRVTQGGQNFGWPIVEGFAVSQPHPDFLRPLYGYSHVDPTFGEEDALAFDTFLKVIIVGNFYQGDQYAGLLANRLIYSEFYVGWVRGLKLDNNGKIVSDEHLGHLAGMTSLQIGPDGFLYAVSLTDSDQVLRVDLAPPTSHDNECAP
jgi:glucose/arabinose dehydrogenase